MDGITLLIFLGIIQGFFLGGTLLTINRGNRRANRVLGGLIIFFSLSISHTVLFNTGAYQFVPHLIMAGFPLIFLFGPLFYFYVQFLITPDQIKKTSLLHFLPFVICVGCLLPFYLQSGPAKIAFVENWATRGRLFDFVIMPLQIIHLFGYLFYIHRRLKQHEKNLKYSFSSIEKINLAWIRRFILMFTGVFGLMALLFLLALLGLHAWVFRIAPNTIALLVAISIYSVGYSGLRQPEIFSANEHSVPVRKYEKSALTPDLAEKYLARLQQVMADEKPYQNSKLTIQELAKTAGIPGYYLSQIINENMNQNFYDFINQHRIEAAKKALIDPKFAHFSILAIAGEVGFNSKSVFNTAFKKYTGMTPSEYRNNPAHT